MMISGMNHLTAYKIFWISDFVVRAISLKKLSELISCGFLPVSSASILDESKLLKGAAIKLARTVNV